MNAIRSEPTLENLAGILGNLPGISSVLLCMTCGGRWRYVRVCTADSWPDDSARDSLQRVRQVMERLGYRTGSNDPGELEVQGEPLRVGEIVEALTAEFGIGEQIT